MRTDDWKHNGLMVEKPLAQVTSNLPPIGYSVALAIMEKITSVIKCLIHYISPLQKSSPSVQ